MSASAKLSFDSRQLTAGITSLPPKINVAIAAVVDAYGAQGENEMRKNAPWTDRTGAARNGLHATATHVAVRHTLTFAHSVPYGIWLEVRWSGRYAIVTPTMLRTGRLIMRDLNKLMRRI